MAGEPTPTRFFSSALAVIRGLPPATIPFSLRSHEL
jgi:hypothetical protein